MPTYGVGVSGIGSFASGLSQGLQTAFERQKVQQELDLRRKMVDAQTKMQKAHLDYQEHLMRLLEPQMGGAQQQQPGASPIQETPLPGQSFPGSVESDMPNRPPVFEPQGNATPTMMDPQIAAQGGYGQVSPLMEQQGKTDAAGAMMNSAVAARDAYASGAPQPTLKDKVTGPAGAFGLGNRSITLGPTGPRITFGQGLSADNQLWASLLQKNGGDYDKARAEYNQNIRATAGARAQAPFDAKANPLNQQTEAAIKAAGAVGSKQGEMAVTSSPAYLQNQGQIAATKAAGTHAGAGEQGLAAATAALGQVKTVAEQLKKNNVSVMGAASAAAGARPGLIGRAARSMGATDAAANLEAAQLPLIQHYESMYAGVRGAASPQLLEMIKQKMITPTDEPKLIDNKLKYFENVFNALSGALKRAAAGQPIPEGEIEKVMMQPVGEGGGGAGAQGPRTAADWLKGIQK